MMAVDVDTKLYKIVSRFYRWHARNKVWADKEKVLRGKLLEVLPITYGEKYRKVVDDFRITVTWQHRQVNNEAVLELIKLRALNAVKKVETPNWEVLGELRKGDAELDEALKALEGSLTQVLKVERI
jgi:hypothetical protein